MPHPFSRLPSPPKRICIVRLSALGDAVHVLPLIHSLKAADPTLHITWIVQHTVAPLVEGIEAIDELIVFDRRKGLRGFIELHRVLHSHPFDLVLALHPSIKGSLATWLTHAPIKLGFDRARAPELNFLFTNRKIDPHPKWHMQDQFFEFLDYLDVPVRLAWGLHANHEARERAKGLLPDGEGRWIGLQIGASKPWKMWNAVDYARLAEHLHAQGYRVALLGGGAAEEVALHDAILAERTTPPDADLVGRINLNTLVAVLERCSLLVSPDTGPLHMAVALGIPVVGLYGATDPNLVGPYRFRDLTVDAYPQAVAHFGNRLRTSNPMQLVGWEAVAHSIEHALMDASHD